MLETTPAADAPPNEEARLRAHHARYAAERAAVAAMNGFTLNDTRPFDTTPIDLARSCVDEAQALCLVLSTAVEELANNPREESPLRSIHIGRSIHAIGTLVALSAFAMNGIQS